MKEFTVKFRPHNKSIRVKQGTDILAAATRCGIVLNAACGGEGLCGKCKVFVKKVAVLACDSIIESDIEVDIPEASIEVSPGPKHDAEDFAKGSIPEREKRLERSPLVRKFYIKVSPPGDSDATSDLERIYAEIAHKVKGLHVSTRLGRVKHLSEVLRESDYQVTVTVAHMDDMAEILAIEPGDTTSSNLGFAFDIGTTTVAGQLIDLNSREILGTRISFNRQASYGSDVITRIIYASNAAGLEELNKAILGNINEIINDLVDGSKANLSDINAVVCAGNMTMMHLLLKIDPANIRKAPYVPTTAVFSAAHSSEAGIEINPRGVVSFIPGVSTYIGGDIVAGIFACGLFEDEGISLLVDIGTNGEIVLGNRDWMMGSAASAGPAFEGSGLVSGMKAVRGAIDKVEIGKDMDIRISVIGPGKPMGICGSGYIDLLCQMLKTGLIGKDGKIDRDLRSKRIRQAESGVYEFVVAFGSDSGADSDIVISEDDIENLKRSKGAIYSAIVSLLNKVEKNISEVKKIYIAGGFGNYLNIENAIFIGLLPDVKRGLYEFVGNSSLAGAREALLSHGVLEKMKEIHKNVTYLDLSSEPNYMDEYIASLFFPHTDKGRFPSVKF